MDASEAIGRLLKKCMCFAKYQENPSWKKRSILISKGGTEHFIEEIRTPLVEMASDESGVVIVFHDITDRKQAEEKRKRLRIACTVREDGGIRTMAGGVAHDLNNVLAASFHFTRN